MKEIRLTKGYFAKVDDDDYDWLIKHSWYAQERGHEADRRRLREHTVARTTIRVELPCGDYAYRIVPMHKLIMDAKPGQMIDHVDGDPLNNCRGNLRFVTNQQNSWNSRGAKSFKGKPTSSRFKGVFRKVCKYKGEPRYKYWVAKIGVDGTEITLGHFKDEENAAKAYDEAAKKYYGEYARLNFPPNQRRSFPCVVRTVAANRLHGSSTCSNAKAM